MHWSNPFLFLVFKTLVSVLQEQILHWQRVKVRAIIAIDLARVIQRKFAEAVYVMTLISQS